jgi:hypothetical protein
MASDAEKAAWHSVGFFERSLPAKVVDAARDQARFPEPSGKTDFGSSGRYEYEPRHPVSYRPVHAYWYSG